MVLTLHSIRRLRIHKFIGNLTSTSEKIKTKSEPLISTALARMLIKSDDQIAHWAVAVAAVRARARNMMYGGLDLWPLSRLIIQILLFLRNT